MITKIPPAALDQHIAVLGKTGVGKSGGIRASIIEPMLDAGERVYCIDPTDTQWGIRLTPEGRPSKYKVFVFGGNHGDRPLNAHEGEAIGEAIGTSSSSVIISTKKMRPRDRTIFFTNFAEALLRTNVGVLHLVIDEAHLFAPQAGGMGLGKEAAAMLHATNDLVSLGRGAGLCIVLATQRPAKVHKDSVSQCETLIAMRMSHPLDQAAIEDWIGLKRIKRMKTLPPEYLERAEQIMGGVQFLADRNAYIWAPDPKINVFDQIAFPTYKTFDSGERNKAGSTITLAPIDMAALEGKLKQVADEAAANDPAKLKADIQRLETELTRAQVASASAPAVDQAVIDAGMTSSYNRGISETVSALRPWAQAVAAQLIEAREKLDIALRAAPAGEVFIDGFENKVAEIKPLAAPPAARVSPPIQNPSSRGHSLPPAAIAPTSAPSNLPRPQQRILDSLATWRTMGHETPGNAQVAWLASYSPSSTSYTNPRSVLKMAGLIDYPAPDCVSLTPAGAAKAQAKHVANLLEYVLSQLTGPEERILRSIAQHYPKPLTNEIAATGANYSASSTSYTNPRSALRSKDLITYPGKDQVRAADWLFT